MAVALCRSGFSRRTRHRTRPWRHDNSSVRITLRNSLADLILIVAAVGARSWPDIVGGPKYRLLPSFSVSEFSCVVNVFEGMTQIQNFTNLVHECFRAECHGATSGRSADRQPHGSGIGSKQIGRYLDKFADGGIKKPINAMRDDLTRSPGTEGNRNAFCGHRFDDTYTEMFRQFGVLYQIGFDAGRMPVNSRVTVQIAQCLLRCIHMECNRQAVRHLFQRIQVVHVNRVGY